MSWCGGGLISPTPFVDSRVLAMTSSLQNRAARVESCVIVDIMLRVNAGAYSFEAANPRHEHEWRVWESVQFPDHKTLIPGVISHSTPLVEHPELIAQRLVRFAQTVGRERVIGGSDCGFSSFANTEPEIHPTIVWAKFQSLAEGARLASNELW